MAITWSRSSERIMPVLPPESILAAIQERFLKPARSKAWVMIGAPVPPPMVTIFSIVLILADLPVLFLTNVL